MRTEDCAYERADIVGWSTPLIADCLDLAWLSPQEALELARTEEMAGGHGVLLRQALAHLGFVV